MSSTGETSRSILKTILKKALPSFVLAIYYDIRKYSLYSCLSTILYWLSPNRPTATLSIKRSGRFVPYLLISLARAGYRIEIDHRFFYPSDINPVLQLNRLPLRVTTHTYRQRPRAVLLFDHNTISHGIPWNARIEISYDYYNSHRKTDSIVMPYYMHPDAYYSRIFTRVGDLRNRKRTIRLFFGGTYDEGSYSAYFHFPMLNRFQILKTVLSEFSQSISFVSERRSATDLLEADDLKPIVMSLTRDTQTNTLDRFSLSHYDCFKLLASSHFFLAPPGLSIPVSHIAVEGIAVGSIPILNNTRFGWNPALEHGKNCLSFKNQQELKTRISQALTLPTETISRMRANVLDYYENYLKPESFAARLRTQLEPRLTLYVNTDPESSRLYEMRSRHGNSDKDFVQSKPLGLVKRNNGHRDQGLVFKAHV